MDVDYIIDQSLKWHISSFNAKSSAVPNVKLAIAGVRPDGWYLMGKMKIE